MTKLHITLGSKSGCHGLGHLNPRPHPVRHTTEEGSSELPDTFGVGELCSLPPVKMIPSWTSFFQFALNTTVYRLQSNSPVMGQQSTTSQVINLWFIAYVYPCFNYKKLRKFSIITVSLLYITTTTSCNCSTTPTDSPTPLVVGGCHSNW